MDNDNLISTMNILKSYLKKLFDEEKHLSFVRDINALHLLANDLNQQFERFRKDSELREERQMSAINKLLIEFSKIKKTTLLTKEDAPKPSSSEIHGT